GPGVRGGRSALDQPDVAGARTLLRFFRRELDTLAFAQQLEHRAAHRASVEEVLDAAFVTDEPEPLVDKKSCNRPARHTRNPPSRTPETSPRALARFFRYRRVVRRS